MKQSSDGLTLARPVGVPPIFVDRRRTMRCNRPLDPPAEIADAIWLSPQAAAERCRWTDHSVAGAVTLLDPTTEAHS